MIKTIGIREIRRHIKELAPKNADDLIRLWKDKKLGVRSLIEANKMLKLSDEDWKRVVQATARK